MYRVIATIPMDDLSNAKHPLGCLLRDLMSKVQDGPEVTREHHERQYRAVAGVIAALYAGENKFD